MEFNHLLNWLVSGIIINFIIYLTVTTGGKTSVHWDECNPKEFHWPIFREIEKDLVLGMLYQVLYGTQLTD